MWHLDFCKLCYHLSLFLCRSLFASTVSTGWRAESLELIAHVHIRSSTSRKCSIPLFRLESPFSSSNRTSRAALARASSPPPLNFRFSPPHNTVIRLTTTVARARTGKTDKSGVGKTPGAPRSTARSTWIAPAFRIQPAPHLWCFFFVCWITRTRALFSNPPLPSSSSCFLFGLLFKCRTDSNCYDRETSGQDPSYHEQFNQHDPWQSVPGGGHPDIYEHFHQYGIY